VRGELLLKYIKAFLFLFWLSGCSSTPTHKSSDNPLSLYQKAKSELDRSDEDYSIEFLRSQAAQYLLSQGKTDLKSGNSIRAVQRFSEARKLNPWNDEIKDFYILSVNALVKVTNRLQNENCDVINDRLGFIYSIAPDQMTEVRGLADKCGFKIGAASTEEFHLLPLSEGGVEIQKSEFENLNEEISRKIKKNSYVPRKELLFLGLSYIADIKIELGNPIVGSDVDDRDAVRVLLPITSKHNGKVSSKEYCEKARNLLQNKEYEEEIGDSPANRIKADGYLECRHFYGSVRAMSFYSSPKWPEQIRNIWPLPKDIIVDFIFHYENRYSKSYRNIVSTLALPDQVEYGIGLKFMYTQGELPFVLRYSKAHGAEKRYVLRGKNDFIEFVLPAHELVGLSHVEIRLNLKETFKDSYEENYKARGKHGPGGLIFDN
jgi:hypothetical protein